MIGTILFTAFPTAKKNLSNFLHSPHVYQRSSTCSDTLQWLVSSMRIHYIAWSLLR